MLVCKSASLSPDGGIKTVWEDSKDLSEKYEIIIPPEVAECILDVYKEKEE